MVDDKALALKELARFNAAHIQPFLTKKAKSVATPKCAELAERFVLTYAVGKEAPPDVDLDAAALVGAAGMVEYLAITRPVVHLAHVFVRATHLRCRHVSVMFDSPEPHMAYWSYFDETTEPHLDHHHPLWALAEVIAQELTDDRRDEVRAILSPVHAVGPLAVRLLCARAMDDAEWVAGAAREFLGGNKSDHPDYVLGQLFEVVDADFANQLSRHQPQAVPIVTLLEMHGRAVTDSVIAAHRHDPNNEHVTKVLATIESIPAATQLAYSLKKARGAAIAKAYFAKRSDLAIAALTPLRTHSELGMYVKPILDALVPATEPIIDPSTEAAPSEIPSTLATAAEGRKELPTFVKVESLPRVSLKNGKLPLDAGTNLVHLLRASKIERPGALLDEVKAACDEASLADFAWGLCEAWLVANAPSLEQWAFQALGHLGDDACARKAGALVLDWANHGQNNRASVGFDVLGAIGNANALMQLETIERLGKNELLRGKTREKLAAIAKARGLTPDELADRSVPDLGIDAHGTVTFDFGSRQVIATIDDDFKLSDLPKRKKTDNAARVEAAIRRFKGIKEDLKTVAAGQLVRLEASMRGGRRWSADDFRTFVVQHPLVVRLARRLVWGIYVSNKLMATFCITDDGSLADERYAAFALAPGAGVGIVLRAEMPDALVAVWSEQLAQYKLLQPFDQLATSG